MIDQPRFEFGKNWQSFIETIDDRRIKRAEESLREALECESLEGAHFLDLGCGSGLFSLAAHRLGARVTSIDYDPQSVECTQWLRDRFADSQPDWEIRQGSVLDPDLMASIPPSDIVYSWGVLHHTGQMDRAIEMVASKTKPGGRLLIAIYNDQGGASRRWRAIKRIYHRLPKGLRNAWVLAVAGCYETKFALTRLARLQNPLPFADWQAKKRDRGMSVWHDWVDWVGGLPFEVAKPEQIIMPLRKKGFILDQLKTVGSGWGCNEYVFTRVSSQ